MERGNRSLRDRVPAGWRVSSEIATEPAGDLVELEQKRTGEPLDVRTAWLGHDGRIEWGAHVDALGYIVTAELVRIA